MKKSLYRVNSRAGGFLLAAGLVLAGSAVAFDINAKDKTDHPSVNIQMDEICREPRRTAARQLRDRH